MSSTNILTLDQGIILMIETGLFLIFYYIYHLFFGDNMPFTSVFFTTLIFAIWLLSITVFSNIALALNVPIKSSSSIPFRDNGMNWKKY
jgi:hypothetical protein